MLQHVAWQEVSVGDVVTYLDKSGRYCSGVVEARMQGAVRLAAIVYEGDEIAPHAVVQMASFVSASRRVEEVVSRKPYVPRAQRRAG